MATVVTMKRPAGSKMHGTGKTRHQRSIERRERALELIRMGAKLADVLADVGVSENAYRKWMATDAEFRSKIMAARRVIQDERQDGGEWTGSHADFAERFFGQRYAWHQQLFIDELEATPPGNILLVLWPPGHGKTSTFENYASERYALTPQTRITIASESLMISRKILGKLKKRMEPDGPTQEYVMRFGPFRPENGRGSEVMRQPWSADYFNVAKRAMSDERDYSCMALGWESTIVSTRCDILHIDDLQSTTTYSPGKTDGMEAWFRQDALSRPGEHGITTMCGTRVGEDDVYSRLIDDPSLDGIMRVIKLQAVMTDGVTGEQRPLWPERYDLDQLERMRRKVTDEVFDRNWMQEPGRTDANRTFTNDMIERCLDRQMRYNMPLAPGTIVYVGLDPSLVGRNCILGAEASPDGKLIVRYINERTNLRSNENVMAELNRAVTRLQAYGGNVTDVVIETMGFQAGLKRDERLQELQRRHGFSAREHLTGINKYADDIGVPSLVTSMAKGELVLPYGDDASIAITDGLVRQMKAWKPGMRGNKLRQDQLMALWFVWILWRSRWKQPMAAGTEARAIRTTGVPWGVSKAGLIIPVGARP